MSCEDEGEMTTASRRRHPCSLAAGPLDDEDLLCEILLRLSPQPSSLPRASLVCKQWRRLVSDPGFIRRFRIHHRRNLPLLGYFEGPPQGRAFVPTLEAPNRVPPGRFSFPSDVGDCLQCLGCRHGLVLIFLRTRLQVLVWDPVTGDQHRFGIPPGIATYAKHALINGAVFRAAGDVQHFQVVLAAGDGEEPHSRVFVCAYSPQTGLWGNIISTQLPSYKANGCFYPALVETHDTVLVEDSLYWVLEGNSDRILEFDLVKQSLAVIHVPVDMWGEDNCFVIMRAEGGGLGVLIVSRSDCTAQLWKRKTDCRGVASWGLTRTIELDKLLSLKSEEKGGLCIPGFAEENNVMFLWTFLGLFMIHLKSLKFNKIFEAKPMTDYHPFEGVYTAETGIGGGHGTTDRLQNA